ncbi:MAG: bifunctional UDP-N-acetylglucosamine diphosphorylase/glucosamine-1-phosphate N-acetyltransferase GlmU [Thermaerobacter sp.]|nr:bifunctional UDP-N-acetylglucosamine diphosphorylase/glucosamine-1-phosphate N-acetyltransferase GlmU [Bacillota bacterium]
MRTVAVILAAGQGTRMRSDLPKVLHPLAGRPMVRYVLEAVRGAGVDRVVAVVGHQADRVAQALGDDARCVVQEPQLGTGHAVQCAEAEAAGFDRVLVVPGDTPLLTAGTLASLLERHARSGAAAVLLTAVVDDPTGYGRVIRDAAGMVQRIVEEADAGPEERAVREINAGVAVFDGPALFAALRGITAANRQNEYYLWDVLPLLMAAGGAVEAVAAADPDEIMGVNDRVALAEAEAVVRRRIARHWMRQGVTLVDPATTYIGADVEIGPDTVIEPLTVLAGRTVVGRSCRIGPGAQIYHSRIGDGCTVGPSVIEESRLGDGVTVGPFNHLRPGTVLEDGARVGNFAELKNTRVGPGSKVPHHSYLGDAEIGRGVNIGAGAVTVNYDGRAKHPTRIEDGAFIGCNVNLVAPVTVGRRGYVAAGSTIHRDVPPEALAIARNRQENKEGWVRRRLGPAGDEPPEG